MAKKKIVKKTKRAVKKFKKAAKITKNMNLRAVLSKYPRTSEVFAQLGLTCAVCGFSAIETIEQAAEAHGIDITMLLKELNKVAK